MKSLVALSLAVVVVAGSVAFAEENLGGILERVYVPPSDAKARIAPPAAAKAATHVVTEGELLSRLEKELAKQLNADGELRITLSRPWQAIRVPTEDWQLTLPELPIGGLSKSFLVHVRVASNDRAWFDQQVVVQAQLFKPVLVATKRLERGTTLDRSAAEIQTMDVLRERVAPVSADINLEEQEVLQTVTEGRPLTYKDIAAVPMVRKGSVVAVVAGEGGMQISMKGMAMGTGAAGDAITIRNLDTRKDFQARVINKNTVRVTF